MHARTSTRGSRAAVLALAVIALPVAAAPEAQAQAVAFQPVVSAFPSGVTLPATPVVSYDRRYVRLTLAPQFTDIEGFDTFSVPAAVSGGGINGGGLGLGAGGLGGLGGVNRLAAGMNGVIEPGLAPGLQLPRAVGPGFASPEAVAVLAGQGGPVAPPRLSAGLPQDPPTPRMKSKAPRAAQRSARAKRK
jgi:hypothetical protein